MFNKLLIKALGKRFNKLSPEEKQNVREMVNNETISETTEKQKVKKRRKKTMADEKEVKTNEVETSKVETENNEVDKDKSTDVVDTKEEKVEETDKKEEATAPTNEETTKDEEPTAPPQVEDTPPQGNGVRVEDLVTKEMLAERLAALEAKFDAVVKENNDLKEKLSSKSEELDGMKDKYENKDFGNFQRQGVMTKDKSANSSFDEYSKAFM